MLLIVLTFFKIYLNDILILEFLVFRDAVLRQVYCAFAHVNTCRVLFDEYLEFTRHQEDLRP